MRWEIHAAAQTVTFLWSLGLGVVLCVWYDFFRLLREHFHRGIWITVVEDLCFWSVSAVATFLFLLAREKGMIRSYVLFGAAIGFALWRLTIGRFLFVFVSRLLGFLKHLICRFAAQIRKIAVLWGQRMQKGLKFVKKPLKIHHFRKKTLENE